MIEFSASENNRVTPYTCDAASPTTNVQALLNYKKDYIKKGGR